MFDMVKDSVILFWQGRLFRDLGKVIAQTLLGMVIAIVLLIGMVKLGSPVWLAIVIAALIAGAIQPYLFKNLKYK